MSISKAVIAKPTLPARYVSRDYDSFLFFDFSIRSRLDFFDELQGEAVKDTEIRIFYSSTLELLGETALDEKWSDKIKLIDDRLESREEHFGLIVSERDGGWFLAQDTPVNWGVFAFNSRDMYALNLFNGVDKDWFLSVDDFKEAVSNPGSNLHESFDMEFMTTLIANYDN